jgi:hypothetical protein
MRSGFGALAAGMAAAILCAGSANGTDTVASPAESAKTPDSAGACARLDAGTTLTLELADPLSSARARRGDAVALRVAEPVVCGGHAALPVGTVVAGEVVHAVPAGRWQNAGELTIAARHLEWNGRRYAVRALHLGGTAARRELSTAREIFAPQSRGHDFEIKAGTRASAKLAEPIVLSPPLVSTEPAR